MDIKYFSYILMYCIHVEPSVSKFVSLTHLPLWCMLLQLCFFSI